MSTTKPITSPDETQIARLIRLEIITDETNKKVSETKDILKERMTGVENQLKGFEERFVTKEEFRLVRGLVFGAAGIILIEFFTAIVYLVIRQQ